MAEEATVSSGEHFDVFAHPFRIVFGGRFEPLAHLCDERGALMAIEKLLMNAAACVISKFIEFECLWEHAVLLGSTQEGAEERQAVVVGRGFDRETEE